MKNFIKSKCLVKSVFSKHAFRVCTVFLRQISKTFPRLRFNFPGLKISPQNLSFPRFQIQFTLPSTNNTCNINSENFIACAKQISKTLLDIHFFSLVLENAPPPLQDPCKPCTFCFFSILHGWTYICFWSFLLSFRRSWILQTTFPNKN